MPRRPNGDRALTSTERGRLYRIRHKLGTLAGLKRAWTCSDDETRLEFRAWIDSDGDTCASSVPSVTGQS